MGITTSGLDHQEPWWKAGAHRLLQTVGLMAPIGSMLAACSVTVPIAPVTARGSQADAIPAALLALAPQLSGEDWRRARGALGIALDPRGNGAPVHWDNPESGVDGSFRSAGEPVVVDGEVCRAFAGTIRKMPRGLSFRGTACRQSNDDWDVTDMEPGIQARNEMQAGSDKPGLDPN